MFTGIIEDIGKITNITRQPNCMVLTISSQKMLEDINLGDSIAVNGVCLTVVSFTDRCFTVDVMPETVKATNIETLQIGSPVNLERAMSAAGRFGGHIVSGHVDGIGKIIRKQKSSNAVYYDIAIKEELSRYCIPKGSITIDGISLTIFGLKDNQLTISIIPHTLEHTVLGFKKENDFVNIENDLIGKYIIHHLDRNSGNKSSISMEFLQQHGF
ncbi:riboflavin synthase [Bacillus sp. AGMB 02131]|uniref:Riboflavin synthase n=1 Tax=Peribacillus faecalis TaxID=2772559 RepID=A0A927CVD2_9BACI|nr:riboflavin synthase [Peribacillus faecalis]MBD3107771.1 riboflavin synthase [Peribacillus faecalis]